MSYSYQINETISQKNDSRHLNEEDGEGSQKVDESLPDVQAVDSSPMLSMSGTPVVMEFENTDEPEFTNNFTKAATRIDNCFSFQ